MLLLTNCVSWDGEWSPSSVPSPLPRRPGYSITGTQFINQIKNQTGEARERAILRQLQSGNLPESFRKMIPVKVSTGTGKKKITGTIYVSPDYLSIGSDKDFVRMPVTPITAQKFCDQFGFVLPTRKMVNDIYRNAKVKLAPSPRPPGKKMTSTDFYDRHNKTIRAQLNGRGRGQLVAGHKKDIVISNQLVSKPKRVAIYGWHRTNGRPIQPLSLVHGNTYVDYSHGVRLISATMDVNGKKRLVRDVLKDKKLAPLISDEGPINQFRQRTDLVSSL